MKFNKFVENILAESNKDIYTEGMITRNKLYNLLFDVALLGATDSEVLKAAKNKDRKKFDDIFWDKMDDVVQEILDEYDDDYNPNFKD